MPNYELELSPTNTPTEGGEGSLDTSLLNGNSIQRTGYITTVDEDGNTKTLNIKDGTAFNSTIQGLGDVLGIILVSDDVAFAATVEIPEDNFTLTMPYWSEGTYSGTINWGDESTSANAIGADHTYATAGTYSITIDGEITGWFTYDNDEVVDDVNGNIHEVLISIDAFGSNFDFGTYATQTNGSLFDGCLLLESIATDIPTENVTTMSGMFYECSVFNQPLSFDTSNVTDMSYMFYVALNFNQPLSFDTSNVTDMSSMFGISSFNQDLSAFDTSSVTDMSSMFAACSSFNQDLSSFDTSNVTDMGYMFYNCSAFNQDLSGWCVNLIPSEPDVFSVLATAWVLPKPNWGAACA